MQDRFKYRAWDKENKKYIYGVEKGLQISSAAGDLHVMTLAEIAESNKYDLEQCTGLKDEKGKLIYEGDILKGTYYIDNPVIDYYPVEYGEDEWLNGNEGFPLSAYNTLSVIVGNIHENSELLEEKQ